ncbi:hypothetical protein [Leptospira alexanderi]|uniref:hypothetical protein n=1 Tax=Leptospira alexanderi TaxID=100053 RepID=UPI001C376857|nr:hypothetical protein [Leptospira alexanderi]
MDEREEKAHRKFGYSSGFQKNQTKTLMKKSKFYFFHKDEYYKAVFCSFERTKKVASFGNFSKKVCRQLEIEKE